MKQGIHILCTILAITTVAISRAEENQTESQFLEVHNTARAEVGVAPLEWNQTLATHAQEFVEKVKKTCDNTAVSGGPYGENTASGYGAFTIGDAVNQWVEEKANYDHKSNVCVNGSECKHYTQVVWKETSHLGCANTTCGAGWPFVVCEYFPAGNVHGKWPY